MTLMTGRVDRQQTRAGAALGVLVALIVICFQAELAAAPQASGVPDLTEVWARRGCLPGNSDVCPYILRESLMTARARVFRETFDELASPRYDCVPATMPSLLADPYNFQIEQRNDRVIFIYEKDDVIRTIWLEGHGHPEPGVYDFFVQGHSIGRYEGNELVVETRKFTFDPTGMDDMQNWPSSTQKSVVERYRREGDRLILDVVVEDSVFLREPLRFSFGWQSSEDPLFLPYACDPDLARQPLQFLPPKYPESQ